MYVCANSNKNLKKNKIYIKTASLLLAHNADPNIQNDYEQTALILACIHSNKEIVELLLNNNADTDIQDYKNRTALFYACFNLKNNKLIRILLEKRADPNLKDIYGYTPLIYACKRSNCDFVNKMVKILLKRGADPDLQDKNGFTALMYVSKYSDKNCNIGVVSMLLDYANPNYQDKNGFSALMLACKYLNAFSSSEAVKILSYNYDINFNLFLYEKKFNALMILCRIKNQRKSVKLLMKKTNLEHRDYRNNKIKKFLYQNIEIYLHTKLFTY